MSRTTATDQGENDVLVEASQRWLDGFGDATLEPADAGDLVESAQRITRIVARAACRLSWQTPDSFVAQMRQAERSNAC